jgi:hypothetical protein
MSPASRSARGDANGRHAVGELIRDLAEVLGPSREEMKDLAPGRIGERAEASMRADNIR